jgi:hypothetical protein
LKKSLFITFCVTLLFFSGCERDDICPDALQTTPNLLIEFYDNENPTQQKSVQDLNAFTNIGVNVPTTVFDQVQNSTSISLPLQTDQNTTSFKLTLNANADSESEFEPNIDTLTISYGVDEIYVNRACGYKVQFIEFDASYRQEESGNNWIDRIQVQQPNNIKNEQNAHLYIYF